MSKAAKPTKRQKQLHFLILKGTKQTHYKTLIEVDYTPKNKLSTLPVFNLDHKHFSPSFLIPSIETENRIDYKAEHQRKAGNFEEKSLQNLFVPQPKTTQNYCSVCKNEYQDYFIHIKEDNHKQKLHSSSFYKQISQFCQMIQFKQTKILKSQETAQKTSTSDTHSEQETSPKDYREKRSYKHIREEILVNDFA